MTLPTYDHALSRDERSTRTADLLDRARGCRDGVERDDLLSQVVVMNLRIARSVAARYRGRGIPLEDLEQAACEGLTKAVHRFDLGRDHDLLTYAVPTIRGEVLHYFRDLSWSVRPPRRVQDLQWLVSRCLDELGHELGREPVEAEVVARSGVTASEYCEAMSAAGCFQPSSLDQPAVGVAGGMLTVGDAVPDVSDPAAAAEARIMLSPVLRRLSARDRRILYLRFVQDQTQREIGAELGVAQVQVSRWLSRILDDLRTGIGTESQALS